MKKTGMLILLVSLFGILNAQQFPEVNLKTLDGKNINSSSLKTNGKPFIICFWKSCCPANERMLDALSEVYEDWQDEFNLKIYAISIDDSRTSAKIRPTVNGKGWTLDFLQDINSDFKRALNVGSVPHVIIYNSKGEIIEQKPGFLNGAEIEIYEILKKNLN
ncbi:TlpA family protein disulfide reductase [Bacteroidales bacterium OttesenSCG-928-L19]|nr:TlpA family protein disulfide reductase [Bacteroidales bacterium OttesenSCG-928-L19]